MTTDRFESTTELSGHILSLDGLRCLAVLQVMLNHYFVATRPSDGTVIAAASNLLQFLGNGVHLFFVLSGYFMTRLPRYRDELISALGLSGQQIDDLIASGDRYRDLYRRGVYGYRLIALRR